MFSPGQSRSSRAAGVQRLLQSGQRGPAQALCERRTAKQPTDPGTFCTALLSSRAYALPDDVDPSTWQVALEHFARTAPPEAEFRRLLEQRARTGPDASRAAGARVAAYLLREWERYGLARLLGAGSSGRGPKRKGLPGRRTGVANTQRVLRLALRGAGASE